ncbi:MAG: biotin/lipoyl-binding protein [Nitrospirae bacterium]|nr:biotin/lipoyl-binding protein [Magnetococcales bacterium]HAT50962.1 secretion protein HylD [Alphaproteobacteria bacterium]
MTPQASPLVVLLQLGQRVRQTGTLEELYFVLVNESHTLIPYRQAVLWNASGEVRALSGVPKVDPRIPFVLWLQLLFTPISQTDIPAPILFPDHDVPGEFKDQWSEWLPQKGVVFCLRNDGIPLGWLLLARDEAFDENELALLEHLTEIQGHAWALHRAKKRPPWWSRFTSRKNWLAIPILLLAVLSIRIPLSALAPGEIVAVTPEVIRSPMDGVVSRFHVQPNDSVRIGQPLFDLDDTNLNSRLEVALKSLDIAESEYFLTAQQALTDPRSKGQLAILTGKVEEKRLEAEGLQALLKQSRVAASREGIALFSDPQGWIGRPVVTGEKILMVAGERETEVEAWLSAGNLIPLEPGAYVTLFLNVDPLHPRSARMRFLAFEASTRPDGTMAHQLRATWLSGATPPRLGLKGMARIEGEKVSIFWWMARRPLAVMRQWVGW